MENAGLSRVAPLISGVARIGKKNTSAHFPKFVLHCRTTVHELRKVMGTSKPMILVPLSI